MMSSMTPSNNSEQLEPLSEKVANSSTLAIEVFGMELVRSPPSAHYTHKDQTLANVDYPITHLDYPITHVDII